MTQKIINNLYLSDNDITSSYYDQLSHKDKNQILNNQYIKKGIMLKGLDFIIKSIISIILSIKALVYIIIICVFVSFICFNTIDKIINIKLKSMKDNSDSQSYFSQAVIQAAQDGSAVLNVAWKFMVVIIALIIITKILRKLIHKLSNGQLYNHKIFNIIYTRLYKIVIQPLLSIKLKLTGRKLLKDLTDQKEKDLVNQLNTKYYDLENNKVVLQHQIMCDAHYKNDQKQYSFNILPEFQHFTNEKSLNQNISNEEKEIKDLLDLYIQTSMIDQKGVIEKLKRELKISKIKSKQDLIDYYDRKNEEIGLKLKDIYENAEDTELIKAKHYLLK